MNRTSPLYTEHLFRPVYETSIATTWAVGAMATPLTAAMGFSAGSIGTSLGIAAGMAGISAYYGMKSLPLLKRQMSLTINSKRFMKTSELRRINQLEKRCTKADWKNDPREAYMGKGYNWGSEHAQRAYQVLDMDSNLSDVQLPFFLKPIVKAMAKETAELGGAPWIHGMGDEKPVFINESVLYGHSFIAGNVGSGKTTLLRMLSINALHLGNVLIILDPKNDHDWKETIKKEMEYLGKGDLFYHIHPSNPSQSARIPLLKHFTRHTEIADRIAPLMGGNGADSPFQAFAYGIINHAAVALDYLNEPIRLTKIQEVIASDRRGLAQRVMNKYYTETLGENWEGKVAKVFEKMGPNKLENMAAYYTSVLKEQNKCEAVEGMIEFALHDEGHYVKMVVALRPVLTALTANPLNELLSAVEELDSPDTRPIVDLEKVINQGGCLYISLDSMTDGQGASYIARLLCAEVAAVAGARYNKEGGIDADSRRVSFFNDEVHASLANNEALVQMAAMGRAAKFQLFLATQTVSDIEAKTDKATAMRFLGLCNNFICLRTTDPATQEYVSEQLGKASISQSQAQIGSGASTSNSLMDYSVTYGERQSKSREEIFPAELLGRLPILQYVARLADGRRLKMKLDILINDDKDGEVAPWAA